MISCGGNRGLNSDVLGDKGLVLQVGEVGSEDVLGPRAVRAVGLGEDDDLVFGNCIFDGLFSGHGCSWRGGCDSGKESANGAVIYTVEHSTG